MRVCDFAVVGCGREEEIGKQSTSIFVFMLTLETLLAFTIMLF